MTRLGVFFLATALFFGAGGQAKEYAKSDAVTLSTRAGAVCAPEMQLIATAKTAVYFENALPALAKLLAGSAASLAFECEVLVTVMLKGVVAQTEVFSAKARRSENWKLSSAVNPLEGEGLAALNSLRSLEDLSNARVKFERYASVPGLPDTFQYLIYAESVKKAVSRLLKNSQLEFDGLVEKTLAAGSKTEGMERILRSVAYFRPKLAETYRQQFLEARDVQIAEAWNTYLTAMAQQEYDVGEAMRVLAKQHRAITPSSKLAATLDAEIANWAEAAIADHKAFFGTDLLDDIYEKGRFAEELAKLKVPGAYPATAAIITREAKAYQAEAKAALRSMAVAARDLIVASADDVDTVADALDAGFALSTEFTEAGFEGVGTELLRVASERVEEVLRDGLEPYRAEMALAEMSPDTTAYYAEQLEIFAGLTEAFPGYEPYLEVIETGIEAGRLRYCAQLSGRLQARSVDPDAVIATSAGELNVAQLSCALYVNSHVLTGFVETSAEGPMLQIETAEEGPLGILLDDFGAGLGGVAFEGGDPMDDLAWFELIDRLTIRPPSGKPNARGLTECDAMAGDPLDPGLKIAGVDFEKAGFDYDFDRAIDACLAAVEHDPQAPRQLYQLARVLQFLGEDEDALYYAGAATGLGYPPAMHLLASLLLNQEGDTPFWDAIDLFKLAASRGFKPSAAMVNELVPPGSGMFRPLPDPTAREMLSAIRTRECSGLAGHSMCVERTGVASKSCFQTKATYWSCEVSFTVKCSAQGLMEMMRAFCPRRSDVMFIDFYKTKNGGWGSRKAF